MDSASFFPRFLSLGKWQTAIRLDSQVVVVVVVVVVWHTSFLFNRMSTRWLWCVNSIVKVELITKPVLLLVWLALEKMDQLCLTFAIEFSIFKWNRQGYYVGSLDLGCVCLTFFLFKQASQKFERVNTHPPFQLEHAKTILRQPTPPNTDMIGSLYIVLSWPCPAVPFSGWLVYYTVPSFSRISIIFSGIFYHVRLKSMPWLNRWRLARRRRLFFIGETLGPNQSLASLLTQPPRGVESSSSRNRA